MILKKSTSSFARSIFMIAGAYACTTNLSDAGFYVGGQLGGSLLKGQHTYINGDVNPSTQGIDKIQGMGFAYGGQLGFLYQPNLKSFLFLEALGLSGSGTLTKSLLVSGATTSDGTYSIKRKVTYGLASGFGMRFNPSLGGYVRLGYEWSSYQGTYTNLTFGPNASLKYTKKRGTFVPGLGIIYNITPSIITKFEYTYTMKRDLSFRNSQMAVNGNTRGFAYAPTEHRLMIHLNYHFGQ